MMMKKKLFATAAAVIAMTWSGAAVAQETPSEAPAAVQALDPVPVAAPSRDVDPALWVVKDADTTIYLFGTVHILKPGLGWFDEAVKTAFESSDRLVLEMVEPPADQSQAIFMKVALDQSGTTLRSKLTEADRAVYDAALTKIGMPVAALDPFDPWAAAVTMQVLGMTKSGFDINSGVEKQLSAAAKMANKPISGVETIEYQLAIFDSLPVADQIAFLNESAKNMDELATGMDRLVELWAKPDPDALAVEMNQALTNRELYRALLTQRNANWAKWISDEMKKPGTTFMAVGAGHLAGSTSVQAMLPAYGISAQRLSY